MEPESEFKHLRITKVHPTFGAEVAGVDFSRTVPDDVFQEIVAAMAKYGVCAFRNTGLDDKGHVDFSRRFGDLDDIRPYMTADRKLRYSYYELFDAGNIDDNGNLNEPDSPRAQYNKGNGLFHVDSSFNPRRASFSILRAVVLPPLDAGGNTDFADTRAAFADLPEDLKKTLIQKDYVVAHSLHHSRKVAAPEFFKDIDPTVLNMNKHRLVQLHEPSGRMNLYIAAHAHHIEGLPADKSTQLLKDLMDHATQEKYRLSFQWKDPSDMVIWDNTSVMHRAGKLLGRYPRDMRRTTVHDASSQAWGLNSQQAKNPGFAVDAIPRSTASSVTV
ncbi:Alpha-ketoglutarate-dependent 2 [Hyphodiscus hymeniophilus]|uniref:Alpha-ketoglutarate-dependent 2 n=1 Tax=Hyphodiscus hymeniophilus TaxID=353542 RepID=A0A9P7AVT5_9HELO|nr:Alpha-ketoglutarate-dependent 2 [Hyphodiscus hymeniophilus]